MIHRFVDLLEEEREPDVIYNTRRHTGGSDREFVLAGNLATPVHLPLSGSDPTAATISQPDLTPNGAFEYAYVWADQAAPLAKDQIRVAAVDGSAIAAIASNPSGVTVQAPFSGTDILGWSADGQQVYYRGENNRTAHDAEIRVVNRDGTGNTLIWSSATLDSIGFGVRPRLSPDKTMFGFWIDSDIPSEQGLWVLDVDGTNLTKIYAAENGGFPSDFYGWSPDSGRLLFQDRITSTSPDVTRIMTIEPDGSNQTTLYERDLEGTVEDEVLVAIAPDVWAPDGSYVVVRLDLGGTDPSHEINKLATDGSETLTALSPQRLAYSATVGTVRHYGPAIYGPRIWWLEGFTDGTQLVVSVKLDGSDYRVDHDMDTDAVEDDYALNGFWKTAV